MSHPEQQQQQQQSQEDTTKTSVKTSAEDEALKKNTDCIYFLASPLTCKKGSECVYRHSDYARMNPRDCYFWLNGNCLNPKCTFRHPPLDGFLETQAITSGPASTAKAPSSHGVTTPSTSAPHSNKHPVPCVYFQQGFCYRGDKCAYLHGSNTTVYKAQQGVPTLSSTELPSVKKASGGLEKCTTKEKKTPEDNIYKSVKALTNPICAPGSEAVLPRNGLNTRKNIAQPASMEKHHKQKPLITNGNPGFRSNLDHNHVLPVSDKPSIHNIKDADECFRESSPGFDVLVDDELADPDYYNSEDQYGRSRDHEGNLDSAVEYERGHSADYRSLTDLGQDMYHDPQSYNSYGMQGRNARDDKGASERLRVGPSSFDRRKHLRSSSPDCIDNSDLRYRLSKQRRTNGLRSVVGRDHAYDNRGEKQSRSHSLKKDFPYIPTREGSLSSRLRGRIKVPEKSSPVYGTGTERTLDRGRNWGRSLPGSSQISSHLGGRLRDRIKGMDQADYFHEGRSFMGRPEIRRETMDGDADFYGPKRLSELKNKDRRMKDQPNSEIHPQAEHGISFEGPKPLSEILKRKRESKTTAPASRKNITESQRESRQDLDGSAEKQGLDVHEESKNMIPTTGSPVGKSEVARLQSSQVHNPNEIVTEGELMVDDEALDEHEYDDDGQKGDEEYEYEQGDDGDYNYEEGEHIEGEDEYLGDEDGDDFAKKIGVMFS